MSLYNEKKQLMVQEGTGAAIAMDIYEKARYYQAHMDYSQQTAANEFGISRYSGYIKVAGARLSCTCGFSYNGKR